MLDLEPSFECATLEQHALLVVDLFEEIRGDGDTSQYDKELPNVDMALELFWSAAVLLGETRADFREPAEALLPFSRLERSLLACVGLTDNPKVTHEVAHHIGQWVVASPVFADDEPVHSADFISKLKLVVGWEHHQRISDLVSKMTSPR